MNIDALYRELLSKKQAYIGTRGIYVLFKNNEVVYVGQSYRVEERIHKHSPEKDFDSFSVMEINNGDLSDFEADLIMKFKPKYNLVVPTNSKYGNMSTLKLRYNKNATALKKAIKLNGVEEIHLGYYSLMELDEIFGYEENKSFQNKEVENKYLNINESPSFTAEDFELIKAALRGNL